MNDTTKNKLPAGRSELDREEIIFTKHYFEHGCVIAAAEAAGYKKEGVQLLRTTISDPDTLVGQFYRELCRDRRASTCISTERKRSKIWQLAEWSASMSEAGKPNDGKLALQCLDMLNRMDGDYAALRIDSKQQIQKQTVNFTQGISKRPHTNKLEMDQVIESHTEVLERKTG